MAITGGLLGLLMFLAGMRIMSFGLQASGQERVRRLLSSLAADPLRGFILGVCTTAALQSSSLTTVLVVGLVHAGILVLPAGIAVILGANVGTTVTAHLISFEVEQLGVFIVLAGFLAYLLQGRHRYTSLAVMGFGILLTGMDVLTGSLAALKDAGILQQALKMAQISPWGGILAGALASALIQSSSAVSAFVIALAKENGIALAQGLFLVFGADIGTCLTSLVAASGTNRGGRRAALAHLIFNIFSAALILTVAPPFFRLVALTSPHLARQIANGHTLYNLLGGLLFLPFVRQFSHFVYRVIPDK